MNKHLEAITFTISYALQSLTLLITKSQHIIRRSFMSIIESHLVLIMKSATINEEIVLHSVNKHISYWPYLAKNDPKYFTIRFDQ